MNQVIRKVRRFIQKSLGILDIIDHQRKISLDLHDVLRKEDELIKAFIYNNSIIDTPWLKFKGISPGGWAVDYSMLYTMYRVLDDMKPKSILEFGLGQSSKMIHQYATFYSDSEAITCEHDPQWIDFFMHNKSENIDFKIQRVELEEIIYKSERTCSIKDVDSIFANRKFDFVIVDAPLGSPHFSRPQIIKIAQNYLKDEFCIIIDDYNRLGEKETVQELVELFERMHVPFLKKVYKGSKEHCLICSAHLRFLTSL